MEQEALKEQIEYDPLTGKWRWRILKPRRRHGWFLGTPSSNEYLAIRIDYKLYTAHRLAWLYFYGEWPSRDIDHINGDRSDNRIENLQVVSRSMNVWLGHRRRYIQLQKRETQNV